MKEKSAVKIIHYCWFGPRPLSKLAIKCMESWKKFLPDYEIKLWNEDNFDFNQNVFVRQAYENKKWAFVSDYARLKALSEYGGIYLDTDMEITKDISHIIEDDCFLGVEDSGLVNAAVIGAKQPHNKFIDDLISQYDNLDKFDIEDIYAMSIPRQITKMLEPLGFDKEKQEIQKFYDGKVVVYPREYFYPLSYDYQDNKFTDNSCMVHRYDATWASRPEKVKLFFRRHNMKFMMKVIDICVSLKKRFEVIFKDKTFWIFLLITLAFFGIFNKVDYAGDTYTLFARDYKLPINVFCTAGRFITALFFYITHNFGLAYSYILSYVLSIICCTLSLYSLYRLALKLTNRKGISIISSILIILNIFIFELFMFWEKGIMLLAVLLNVLAANFLLKGFKGKKINFIFSFICMFLANSSYQGTVGIFICISLVIILKYSNNIRNFILNNCVVLTIYIIPALLNLSIVKLIFNNSRVASSQYTVLDKIYKILPELKGIFINTFNILPKYTFIIFFCIVTALLILLIFKSKKLKYGIISILSIVYIVLGVVLSGIAPQIMLEYNSIWILPRNAYSLASLIGILILYTFSNIENINRKWQSILIPLLVSYVLLQFVSFQRIFLDHYIVNYLDNINSYKIISEINDYEERSGNRIYNLAIYNDESHKYTYDGIKLYAETNLSVLGIDWSIPYILSYNSGREFEVVEKNDGIFKKYFEGKNWDEYSNEQLIFDGNTLHICIY